MSVWFKYLDIKWLINQSNNLPRQNLTQGMHSNPRPFTGQITKQLSLSLEINLSNYILWLKILDSLGKNSLITLLTVIWYRIIVFVWLCVYCDFLSICLICVTSYTCNISGFYSTLRLCKCLETLDRDFDLYHCLHLQSMIYIFILQMYIR